MCRYRRRPRSGRSPGPLARACGGRDRCGGAVGLLLLSLAAGDALAGAELGGRGDDQLRGAARDDRLAGFGGEDGILGLEDGDWLSGGPGRDVLYGGAGDDFLEAKDRGRDYVDCGGGRDAASVDPEDLVSRSCEMVYPA